MRLGCVHSTMRGAAMCHAHDAMRCDVARRGAGRCDAMRSDPLRVHCRWRNSDEDRRPGASGICGGSGVDPGATRPKHAWPRNVGNCCPKPKSNLKGYLVGRGSRTVVAKDVWWPCACPAPEIGRDAPRLFHIL